MTDSPNAPMGASAPAADSYNGDDIKVLHGLEAVRLRPAMYIGDTFERGYHHCVYEIVDNAIDEAMAGYCRNISVTLGADGSCSVEDDGRGIPVDEHPEEHRPTVEVVLTVLHAGGKFEGKGYKVSGGLHGVGASCVNALSDWFIVWVKRGGRIHRERFSAGLVTHPLEVVGECPASETGTKVQFHLDKAIFHDDSGNGYEFSWDTLSARLEELSFLNPGVRISLADERTGRRAEYLHEDGIRGFVRALTRSKPSIEKNRDGSPKSCRDAEIIHMSDSREIPSGEGSESVSVEVALQYCDGDYEEHLYTFANNINTHEGGTHLVGFCTALSRIVNDAARNLLAERAKSSKKNAKAPQEFTAIDGRDIRHGLYGVISVKLSNPQFEGQTKTKLGNADVKGIVQSIVYDRLKTYFDEHPEVKTAIIEKALVEQQLRERIKKVTEEARKDEGKLGKFLGKLRDCSSRDRSECELFIVEGDSAGGSATQGRDRRTQAILPLRGKVLNVQKANLEAMLRNNEIRSLISAIGGGYGNGFTEIPGKDGTVENRPDFDVAKIRYDKIVIMTDADVDGAHIRTLLLTFFYNQMRPLIAHGHVYLAQPPLYGLKKGKSIDYIESDAKLTARLIELGAKEFTLRRPDGSVAVPPERMPDLTTTVAAAESLCSRLEKQRVDLDEFFRLRTPAGAFPNFFVSVDIDGNPSDSLAFSRDETDRIKAAAAADLAARTGLSPEEALARLDEEDNPNFSCTEIKQAETLRTQMDNLADLYGFSHDDFRGRKDVPLGVLVDSAGKETPVASLRQVLAVIRSRGAKGFTIQRYKGLGEMDKDQLFDTTMAPGKRKLLQVRLDDAVEADRVFAKLMGDDVAPRRRWIEENSLMAEIDA